MPDCIFDTTVIAFANGDIAARKTGNVFDRRLSAIERSAQGNCRVRYNQKLLAEYEAHVPDHRNDVIELFFAALTERGILVARNTLSRQDYATATRRCRWPTHDQHLLAAALQGDNPTLFVTEQRLADCTAKVRSHFGVDIQHLA